VKEGALPALATDEVREYELKGAKLLDGKGRILGRVTGVFPTKRESVLSVETKLHGEVLLPFSRELIAGFKRISRRLVIRLRADVDWERYVRQEELNAH